MTSRMMENTQNVFHFFSIYNALAFLAIPLKCNFLIMELDFLIQGLCHSSLLSKDDQLEVSVGLIN